MAAFTKIMARDLEEYGVQAFLLIPDGPTRTGMVPKEMPEEFTSQILLPDVVVPLAYSWPQRKRSGSAVRPSTQWRGTGSTELGCRSEQERTEQKGEHNGLEGFS
jgi:hypothetical protein